MRPRCGTKGVYRCAIRSTIPSARSARRRNGRRHHHHLLHPHPNHSGRGLRAADRMWGEQGWRAQALPATPPKKSPSHSTGAFFKQFDNLTICQFYTSTFIPKSTTTTFAPKSSFNFFANASDESGSPWFKYIVLGKLPLPPIQPPSLA